MFAFCLGRLLAGSVGAKGRLQRKEREEDRRTMFDHLAVYVGRFLALLYDDSGQDLTEYMLLMALIAVVCIVSIALLGGNIGTVWSLVSGLVPS
jgi:Flp pilus assembly pilin Flp